MAQDPQQELSPPARRSGPAMRHLLLAGVAGAAILGVGLGLWARPGAGERRAAVVPAARVIPNRRVEIVVDEHPAPAGVPLDVMPAANPAAAAPPALAAPVQRAPVQPPFRPPPGIVQVAAPAALRPAAAPATVSARPVAVRPTPVVAPRPRPALEKLHELAKARTVRPLAKRPAAPRLLAIAHKTAAAGRKPAAVQHALIHAAPHHVRPEPVRRIAAPHKPKLVEVRLTHARKPAERPKPAKAEHKPAPARPRLVHRTAPAPRPPARPAPHGSGPLHLISTQTRCASPDPGAALACADPVLGAADRQLTRAYRAAEAAGVPAGRLQQGQQRWLAARAAAARQAPWAVRDVYAARIAELQDMTRQAQGGGY